MELGHGDPLSAADLELLLDALAHHRRAGTAAAQLRLAGRVQRALLEQRGAERVLAEEAGPASGRPALIPFPGGQMTDPIPSE